MMKSGLKDEEERKNGFLLKFFWGLFEVFSNEREKCGLFLFCVIKFVIFRFEFEEDLKDADVILFGLLFSRVSFALLHLFPPSYFLLSTFLFLLQIFNHSSLFPFP